MAPNVIGIFGVFNVAGGLFSSDNAWFLAGSSTGANTLSSVDKYVLASDSRSSGTALSSATAWSGAAGNTLIGMLFGGSTNPSTSSTAVSSAQVYTYLTQATTSPSAMGTARAGLAGAAGSAKALFTGGVNNSTQSSITETYTYATTTHSTGTSVSAVEDSAGVCDGSIAWFAGGYSGSTGYSSVIKTYNVSSGSVATSGNSLSIAGTPVGFSNSSIAIFASIDGFGSHTNKFSFASGSVATSATLSYNLTSASQSGTSNATYGIIGGGDAGGTTSATSKYSYAGDSFALGTNLSSARMYAGATA